MCPPSPRHRQARNKHVSSPALNVQNFFLPINVSPDSHWVTEVCFPFLLLLLLCFLQTWHPLPSSSRSSILKFWHSILNVYVTNVQLWHQSCPGMLINQGDAIDHANGSNRLKENIFPPTLIPTIIFLSVILFILQFHLHRKPNLRKPTEASEISWHDEVSNRSRGCPSAFPSEVENVRPEIIFDI